MIIIIILLLLVVVVSQPSGEEMIEAEKQEEMSQKTYEELMNESASKRAKDPDRERCRCL